MVSGTQTAGEAPSVLKIDGADDSASTQWLEKFGWLIPVCVAIAVYYVAINNFFTSDDFIWLSRARTFSNDWLQIFRVDVTYFDPLVHLMFVIDSLVAGVDGRWYHSVDVALHAANAYLVYRFVRNLSRDTKAAVYAGSLFAGSFAIADAVLWPSSRVDLVSTFFAIGVLIQFLRYLREESTPAFLAAFVLYLLSLAAKGTPLVLPIILLWLLVQEKRPWKRSVCLVPFAAVNLLYVILLKVNSSQASMPIDKLHFSTRNVLYAFCDLFIPEPVLSRLDLAVTSAVLFLAVSALALVSKPWATRMELRRTGYFILLLGIIPVLVTTDFKLLGDTPDVIFLLLSPSHRIYLASVGAAVFGAGVLRALEAGVGKVSPRAATAATVLVLAGVLGVDAYHTRARDEVWQEAGEVARVAFEGLREHRQQIPDGAQIGLVNFPGSHGFVTPMAKVALERNDLTVIKAVKMGVTLDVSTVSKVANTFLFVFGKDGRIYDRTTPYRRQLWLNVMFLSDPRRQDYAEACKEAGTQLYREIVPLL